jgi:hypothetical protein
MKSLKKFGQYLLPAPFFLAGSFILVLYLHNIGELFPRELLTPFLAALIFSTIFLIFFSYLLKDKIKGTIFSSFFIILFFSYGEVVLFLTDKIPARIPADDLVFPLWIIIWLILFRLIKKTKKTLLPLNKFLLLLSIFAILIPLLGVSRYEIKRWQQPKAISPLILPSVNQADFKNGEPDIYYIIPDSYASTAVLKKYLNYDQSAFVKDLEKKGFYVPTQATSNYPKTSLSVASTLNMEYLDYLSEYKNSSDQTAVMPLINNSNVKKFLGNFGYKYYQLGASLVTPYNPDADRNFILPAKWVNLDQFSDILLKSTMLSPLIISLPPGKIIGTSDTDVKNQNEYQFTMLPEIAKLPGPKFVFAHLLSPHLPYIYGRNCEILTKAETEKMTDDENFANQTACTSLKLEKMVDQIIKNSKTPPIILIQSDEGVPYLRYELPTADDWGAANDNLIKEKFPIFSAYYLPGVSTATLYSSISNVNSFRIILNQYFSAGLPILPDKNYIFPNLQNLYQFTDVTAKVR